MLRLRDIMTRDLLALSPETSLREAVAVLAEHHVSGAPVVMGNRVVGVLSASDIIDFQASGPPVPTGRDDAEGDDGEAAAAASDWERDWAAEDEAPGTYFTALWSDTGAALDARFATTGSPEWDQLGEHTVAEAMHHGVRALGPSAAVDTAAALMARAGIHRVLVMEGEALLGIVTTSDVTRAVAEHRLGGVRQFVFGRPRR